MSPDYSGASPQVLILMVDDHPAVRAGVSLLVSSEGMEVCAEAGSRDEALARLEAHHPDLAIVDLSLNREDGLLLVAELKARAVPVLIYSMHCDAQHVEDAFAAGARGYVTKSEFSGVLVEAIQEVCAGHRFLSPKTAVALSERIAEPHGSESRCSLSAKEREVYRLLGDGESTFEIAAAMSISTHTVESYYARIQLKLGLEGMHELRRHAIEHFRRQPQ